MQRIILQGLFLVVITMLSGEMFVAIAQEVPAGEPSSSRAQVSEKRRPEFYTAFSILGTIPKDKNLNVGEAIIPNTDVKGSVGAGIKFGGFPTFAGGVFGFEGEIFGHGGKLSAPQAQGNLTAINFMTNVLARYPGEIIQPYVGAGFGPSLGLLRDSNIQVAGSQLVGNGGSMTLAYQFLGGVRAYVTKKVFLFGEYKYFAANYTWRTDADRIGSPSVNLKFQTQIISGGIGISF